MKKKIIFSDGGKGGVGKSMTSICLADYFIAKGDKVWIIESDITNPDVNRIFEGNRNCYTSLFDLRETNDWMEFLHSIETSASWVETVIINLPAAINIVSKLEEALGILKALNFETAVFFTINRHADSVNLLGESLSHGPMKWADQKVVVMNGFFGKPEDFQRFNDSEVKEHLFDQRGAVMYLPELWYKTVDSCLLEHQTTFSEVLKKQVPIVFRYQVQQWISDIHKRIEDALNATTGNNDESQKQLNKKETDTTE